MKSKLPDCHLIEVLRRKSEARNDVEFDYIARLDELRDRIGAEVRFINQLFPEYTPHDEEYHLSRLFYVADTLIEAKRYREMNAGELFVLACGLYGHDWGMAVSDAERDYITSGELPNGFVASDFALLHDEQAAFKTFAKDAGLEVDKIKSDGVPSETWREYVRKTHALRSGVRLRHYFEKLGYGVGEASARVAEGHWLNIQELEDPHRFPANFSVLQENINLPAIAVYVRLIDLLDIGHDRTPYVIWKFVAPRNTQSRMEWAKHRALQPITCPSYLKGRVIVIDGSTDDHEVFAALEDLHNYCEKQLRECMDLLSRLADERDLLDLYHLEWRVVANGFDPVLVRFEFDRDKVFEILSNEIYQGDTYVFLRELLQNSIDAIRTRRELLQRAGINPQSFGLIRVDVQDQIDGGMIVSWTDDGIGIDEHILRNYLAVAGRSYYQSKDFEREGLSFDPISRFGIGILSCFMAGDVVEIETQKDPYASHAATTPLRIKIPAVTGQFRVEKTLPHEFGIGTRVRVYIDANKFDQLDVTRYLKIVAAFCEFPILVSEENQNLLILHPESQVDVKTDPRFVGFANLKVHKLNLRYPTEQAIVPQDFEAALSLCTEECVDIREDLGFTTCEGRITYLRIKDPDARLYESKRGGGVSIYDRTGKMEGDIRWAEEWSVYARSHKGDWVRSATPNANYSVYRDGILVPDAEIDEVSIGHAMTPKRRIVVNLIQDAPVLSVSRTQVRNDENWFQPIDQSLNSLLERRLNKELKGLDGIDRLNRIGLFAGNFQLASIDINNIENYPVPILDGSELRYEPWHLLREGSINVLPPAFAIGIGSLLENYRNGLPNDGYLRLWRGKGAIVNVDSEDLALNHAFILLALKLEATHIVSSLVLLKPPGDFVPLPQEVWKPRESTNQVSVSDLARRATEDPLILTAEQREMVLNKVHPYTNESFVTFPNNSETPFKVLDTYYNINHPVAKFMFRCFSWLASPTEASVDVIARGNVEDALDGFRFWSLKEASRSQVVIDELVQAAKRVGIMSDSSTLSIQPDELWYPEGNRYAFHSKFENVDTEFGHVE